MENNHPHTHDYHHRRHNLLQWLILVLTALILAIFLFQAVKDITGLHRQGYIRRYRVPSPMVMSPYLRGWMTFSFINQQYKLPANYLKTSLNIAAKNYPNISIDQLAAQQKLTSAQVLQNTQKAIESYLAKPQ